jgi:hypothetical protein
MALTTWTGNALAAKLTVLRRIHWQCHHDTVIIIIVILGTTKFLWWMIVLDGRQPSLD